MLTRRHSTWQAISLKRLRASGCVSRPTRHLPAVPGRQPGGRRAARRRVRLLLLQSGIKINPGLWGDLRGILHKDALQCGIDGNRIVFGEKSPLREHRVRIRPADLRARLQVSAAISPLFVLHALYTNLEILYRKMTAHQI
ncbi:hypothetical protein [Burkholderia sp. 572]|uniref:hypothetical protein n=1 Tax=Burkholderia sp. 572 TaxID=3156414 RepID=UPI0033996FC9